MAFLVEVGCFMGVSEDHLASLIRVDVNMIIRHSTLLTSNQKMETTCFSEMA